MFALAPTSRRLVARAASPAARRRMSSALEGDTGALGTRIHHAMTTGLAFFTPLYMLTPDSYTDGALSKTFGLLLSVNISAHSWIGLNYVCRDYVPKVRRKYLVLTRCHARRFSRLLYRTSIDEGGFENVLGAF